MPFIRQTTRPSAVPTLKQTDFDSMLFRSFVQIDDCEYIFYMKNDHNFLLFVE